MKADSRYTSLHLNSFKWFKILPPWLGKKVTHQMQSRRFCNQNCVLIISVGVNEKGIERLLCEDQLEIGIEID